MNQAEYTAVMVAAAKRQCKLRMLKGYVRRHERAVEAIVIPVIDVGWDTALARRNIVANARNVVRDQMEDLV
jgi:hypothetical protein